MEARDSVGHYPLFTGRLSRSPPVCDLQGCVNDIASCLDNASCLGHSVEDPGVPVPMARSHWSVVTAAENLNCFTVNYSVCRFKCAQVRKTATE